MLARPGVRPSAARPRPAPRLLAAVLAVTALAGCGAAPGSRAGAQASRPGAEDGATLPAAPDIRPASAGQVLAAVKAPGAGVVVLNVWATWCGPCREEFPDLVRLHRDYRGRGLRLVLVSADAPDSLPAARDFLRHHGVDVPSYLKTGSDMAFIDALTPSWTGALPATLIYDGHGRLMWFHEGKANYGMLEREISKVLGVAPSHPKETRG